MYRTTLEVVNACIATMGEAPINSLTDEHVYKQPALNYLKGSKDATLKKGWWFNKEVIRLVPDNTSRFIYIPQDALSVNRSVHHNYTFAQRGRRLYDPIRNSYEWETAVVVELVTSLDFEDLPFVAQDAISLAALLRFQREFDGDGNRYNQIDSDRARADYELNAQHLREVRPNLLAPIRTAMAVRGITRYHTPNHVAAHYAGG